MPKSVERLMKKDSSVTFFADPIDKSMQKTVSNADIYMPKNLYARLENKVSNSKVNQARGTGMTTTSRTDNPSNESLKSVKKWIVPPVQIIDSHQSNSSLRDYVAKED